jgi:hypothetical protein
LPRIGTRQRPYFNLPKKSLNPGLRADWYEPSSSEFEAC